jgi:hypothetical protein
MSYPKSIETVYGGITYRSRTEARWAALFNLAEIDFQYEPEGYDLHSGRYVPDFWMRPWGCFFEVKPESVIIEAGHYCQERSLAEDLAMATERDVLFGCGSPHVMMKLARVPVFGIHPVHEWLTDHIPAHLINAVAKHRFDWNRAALPQGGDTGTFTAIGRYGWQILKDSWTAKRDQ